MTAWSAPQPAESRIWKHGMKMKRRFEPWTVLQRAAAAAGLAVLLTACGGNTSQVESFTPTRLIAFGDEASAFAAGGQKYAVNDAANGCRALPIWASAPRQGRAASARHRTNPTNRTARLPKPWRRILIPKQPPAGPRMQSLAASLSWQSSYSLLPSPSSKKKQESLI